jgi:hypothetical protein
MPTDIQFTYPQQVIKVSSVALVPEAEEPTLRIVGEDFTAIDEVLLNDIPSPLVVVQSPTLLTAVMPIEVRNTTVVNVVVVSYRIVFTAKSIVSFQFGRTNRKTSGINRLLQLFLKTLLTTPGSDIFRPGSGGGALRNLGRTFSKDNAGGVVGDLVVAVDTAAKHVIAVQSRKSRLPRDERLLSAQVTGARFDASQTALIATILLISQAGTTIPANLVL